MAKGNEFTIDLLRAVLIEPQMNDGGGDEEIKQ